MKKKLLLILSILVLTSAISTAYARTNMTSDLSTAIRMYKAGNYSECYLKLGNVIKKDPANALAYYYMAMTSAQLGKKDEAIENYEKTITLTSTGNNLGRYAAKGKRCLETPDKCQESLYDSELDEFIQKKHGPKETQAVRSDYEKLKIENMMREINRLEDIEPQKFREYKDFSSMNNDVPSNDEIVAALRTLQKAGLGDFSLYTGNNQQQQLMNMLGGASISPQVLQTMLTNNMSFGL